MDDGTRKMDSVSRRTRSHWREYFKNCHSELKTKDQENGGLSVGKIGKRGTNMVVYSETSKDGNGALKSDAAGILKIQKDDENNGTVGSDRDDGGIEMFRCDGDEVVSSLAEGYGNATIGADSLRNSTGGKARIKPLDFEQIHPDISLDSERSIGKRNSSEDSNGLSDESGDLQVSESEPTSEEEDDEHLDEDYNHDESSSSESSEYLSHGSDNRLVKDGECGENEGIMIMEEENFSDTVEDERTPTTHEKCTRKNPRIESVTEHEKDDEGCNGDDRRNNVKKNKRRNTEKESDDEIHKTSKRRNTEKKESDYEIHKKKRKGGRRNQKEDDEEEIQQEQVEYVGLNSVSKSQSKKPELGKCSYPLPFESAFPTAVKISGQQHSKENVKLGSRKSHSERDFDFIKSLIHSMNSAKENQYSIDEDALADDALPLKFRFEDEIVPPPEKSEWEKHIDSLFHDLELGLRESETDCSKNVSKMENDDDVKTTEEVDESIAAACSRGKHHAILDEQIGIICYYCDTLIMDIRHVLPDFHTPARDRRDRMYYYDESPSSLFSDIQFQGSASSTCGSTSCTKGTIWELVPGVEIGLKPHQREGIEFIWRNIAGDIILEKLKQSVADDARGCIISHAPGTGKTRLTIAFLQTFLKLYPACSPMIMAPRGMLLTWEAEFKKWNFNIAFHNLNKKELSGKENEVATRLLGQANCGILSKYCIRLLKLYSWSRGGSVLGISYTMFERLVKENGRGQGQEIREVLLERPGLLVLDEGHTPRNERSQIWKALTKVTTHRRVILSGTPFQNNLKELYNTLCVVNPKVGCAGKGWSNLNNKGDALKLRAMLDPFVHVQDGSILEESLPGLRHTLVFLHPTECQKTLLKSAREEGEVFRRIRMVSLVSVHPSIAAVMERYPVHHNKLQELKSDVEAGVKTRFLMKLIYFSDALGERVLVFSQYLDSLAFIKEQLESNFSWNEGREVLHMDGQLEDSKRQNTISSFNDDTSKAKVLLASVKACSEGITLTGASRVVLLDTVWNPAVEKQAISRAYRLGQKRVVHVYRLFMSAIDEIQYAQQFRKEQMSRWIFSLGDGRQASRDEVTEDKVLESMLNLDNFNHIFEKIISQPKESDLIKTFGLEK